MKVTLYKAFFSEYYKLSKNKEIFILTIGLPIFLIFAIDGYILYDVFKNGMNDGTINPWKNLLGKSIFQFFYLLYPMIVAIFVSACCDVEYKNNNYKILFTLPASRFKIFISKVLFILLTILFSILLSYLVFLLSGYLLSIINPEFGFQNYDFREVIFFVFLKFYITLSAVSMIQLFLNLQFKNFIYPLSFSIMMLIFSSLVWQKGFSDFIPYTGAFKSYINILEENIKFEKLDYINIILIFLFLILNYIIFKKKK